MDAHLFLVDCDAIGSFSLSALADKGVNLRTDLISGSENGEYGKGNAHDEGSRELLLDSVQNLFFPSATRKFLNRETGMRKGPLHGA